VLNVLRGFRDFITKGNLLETAVALVMALATTALVKALIDSLITPIIGAIFGETDFSGLTFTINGSVFFYGAFISALITFVSTGAAVYFFIVKPYQRYQEHKGVASTDKDCPHCLSSIPLNANRCAFCTQPV
jgi:large conductance mechanosensitive channel